MKIAVLFAALHCICTSTLVADQQNTGQSASGHVSYELRGKDDAKELWVWRDGETAKAVKLCDTPDWGNMKVFFSPDDRWIIVQDGGGSLGVSLRLFHRAGEVAYQEKEDANIDGKAEVAALKADNPGAKEVADHCYAECLDWSADSNCILVRVSGKGAEPPVNHVQFRWIGVYDLSTGKISTDLSRLNKPGVRRWPNGATIGDVPFVGVH